MKIQKMLLPKLATLMPASAAMWGADETENICKNERNWIRSRQLIGTFLKGKIAAQKSVRFSGINLGRIKLVIAILDKLIFQPKN